MKTICYLADASNPHVKKWCDFFLKKNYKIHIISINGGDIEGVTVHNFQKNVNEVRNEGIFKKTNYISDIKKMKKLIHKIKPDILHAQYASSYGFLGSLMEYHPFVVSVWGTDIYDFPNNGFIQKSIIKHNFKKADYIFSNSIDMGREANLYTNKKVHITFFGVDMNRFKPIENIKDNQYFTIGIVKSLEKKYGLKYLIEAFDILMKKFDGQYNNKKLRLLIGGSGNEEINLKKQVDNFNLSENVEFLGRINPENVANTYNIFDISVFPSLREGFGVAAIESQACEVPVVVTRVGGHPESLDENKTGFIVESKNSQQIANAIEKFLIEESLVTKMGKAGRIFVKSNYEVNDNFNDIAKIYDKIIAESKKM